MNYYNEHDKSAAQWLRELITRGEIPAGDVDERSITEVKAHELNGYTQCHFFAGISGWPLALKLAGFPATRPVWTGSCPCQPFSAAGAGKGETDERHLWPVFFGLIRERGPGLVFGEQVASSLVVGKVGGDHSEEDGPVWLDGVCADLEAAGYATGAVVLGAHSVGAPHIRQRLYWLAESSNIRLADSERAGLEGHAGHGDGGHESRRIDAIEARPTAAGCGAMPGNTGESPGNTSRLADVHGDGRNQGRCGEPSARDDGAVGNGGASGVAHAERHDGRSDVAQREPQGRAVDRGADFWADSRWLLCRDGKHRRISTQPEIFPLADGLPYKLARRGSIRPALLKGAGNAIVPQVAALFVSSYLEAEREGVICAQTEQRR